MAPVRILLVEDNDVFREALELLLGLRSDVEVVGAVGSGEEALALLADSDPDVVLMDYRLPGMDGVQATKALLERDPALSVVCLTGEAAPREIDALLGAGAVACLTKDQELGAIVSAIVEAAA